MRSQTPQAPGGVASSGWPRGTQACSPDQIAGNRGFTLIEVLVVLAIIVLLASIFMPALTSAREMALRVNCAANLRTLHTYTMQYAELKDGRLLPVWETDQGTGGGNSKVGWWYRHLTEGGAHAGTTSEGTNLMDSKTAARIIRCPAATNRPWSNYFYTPYGLNSRRPSDVPRLSVLGIAKPEQTLLFADSAAPGEGNFSFNSNNRGVFFAEWSALHYRHARGTANGVFLDGHVVNITPEVAQAHTEWFTGLLR